MPRLLPQLDQQVIFSAFNFNLPPDVDTAPSVTIGLANSTGYATFINSLLCPTDSVPVLVTVSGTLNATHNYNVNTGSAYPVVQIPVAPLTGMPNGPFFENSRVSPANFVDGMSNTVAVTETVRSIPGYRRTPAARWAFSSSPETTRPPVRHSIRTPIMSRCA